MANLSPITSDRWRLVRQVKRHAVAMTMLIAAVMLMMPSCQRKPMMAHADFVHLPQVGWLRSVPLSFMPVYDDSTTTYDIALAVRHENAYAYRNLSLLVDVIAADSTVSRNTVDIMLADEYGNWQGGGFGTLYQSKVTVVDHIKPEQARKVIIWQVTAPADTLHGIADIGIITSPN